MNLCNHISVMGEACDRHYGHAGMHLRLGREYWPSEKSVRLACICDYRDADDQPVDFCPVHDNSEAKLWELCDCCVMREPTEALLTVIDRGWDGINIDANGWCDVTRGTQLCSDCTETYLARLWPPGFLGLWYKGGSK